LCRKGDTLIDNAAQTLEKLRNLNKKLFFVTNNSQKSRVGFQSKFAKLGIKVNTEGEINKAEYNI
jgi:ribonucleotide monophosphatase NagD (HAD superfamily)